MTDTPEHRVEGQALKAQEQKPLGENAFLKFVQRPRIMLSLLAAWSFLTVLSELFVRTQFITDIPNLHGADIEGALGSLAFGFQGLPLGVLYLYCSRAPVRYQRIFWLALLHQGALVAAILYHWSVTNVFSIGSVWIPLIISAGLLTLVFLHLFQPRDVPEDAGTRAVA
jgi:hypothetical protein